MLYPSHSPCPNPSTLIHYEETTELPLLTESSSEEEAVAISAEHVPHSTGHIQWKSAGVQGKYPGGNERKEERKEK